MKNRIVLESKSVNDRVIELANYVGNSIIENTNNAVKKKSNINNYLYTENTFTVTVDNFLKDENVLTVHYIMYYVESQREYYTLMTNLEGRGNSEADEDTNTITIVSGFISNKIAYDFYETISHELNHLFQYGRGMEKRKELYDKTRELLNLKGNDNNGFIIGLCAYYSFKHEQDSFAHQYYSYLTQNKLKGDLRYLMFDSPFRQMDNAYKMLLKIQHVETVMKQINYLGFSVKGFVNYVRYRRKRFKAKIKNVIRKYLNDNAMVSERYIMTAYHVENERMNESNKYGYEIKWGTESVYDYE